MIKRRQAIGRIALALCPLAAGSAAWAQEFPARQIRILSPYGPGGGNTLIANDVLAKSPAGLLTHLGSVTRLSRTPTRWTRPLVANGASPARWPARD